MWTKGELRDGSQSIFHLPFSLFSAPQFYKPSIYHLPMPSCVLVSYHPLLTIVLLLYYIQGTRRGRMTYCFYLGKGKPMVVPLHACTGTAISYWVVIP